MTTRNPGSFRDPSGYVISSGNRILRAVSDEAYANFRSLRSSGAYDDLRSRDWIVAAEEADAGAADPNAPHVLEHPKIPFVSYPYEWPFSLLKRAALLHLDVHLRALDFGFTLSDASAYNVQFRGVKPVFIDLPSFVPYRDGDYWTGQRQFVEQFVNPLLLRALFGISPNMWYRGAMEGVPTADIARLIGGVRRWLVPSVLTHITLPDLLQRRVRRSPAPAAVPSKPLPQAALRFMLQRLRAWVSRLEPKSVGPSEWQGYGDNNQSYAPDEEIRKRDFIAQFARTARPVCAWDLGCNTGNYSELLLHNGAGSVIGFDSDFDALESAVGRASTRRLPLLPLFLDAANPSPQQGWAEVERSGLHARVNADAIMALALVHHLAIGRNVPLPSVIAWLVGLAPRGVIEFVPKSDAMVQRMLRLRKDVFPDYDREQFEFVLRDLGRIERAMELSPGGRTLYQYERLAH